MGEIRKLKLKLELYWWLFTLILLIAVLLPIWLQVNDFPFYIDNAIFIIAFVTFSRYIFLLKHTFLAKIAWIKLLIIALSAIVLFILIIDIGDFSNYLDEEGLQTLVTDLPYKRQRAMMQYIRNELIFFGVGSVIACAVLPVRMLISIWRFRNRGSV